MAILPLENNFSAEFDTLKQEEWNGVLSNFNDANIYQTRAYDTIRQGEKNISHCLVRLSGKIVAAAQARIEKLPLPGFGAAYMRWAPLWRKQGEEPDPLIFRMAIRALRNEYVLKRGLFLRIFPLLFDDEHVQFNEILREEKFAPAIGETPQQTLLLNIGEGTDGIRKNFEQKWRNCLNKAERNGLEIVEGTNDELFEKFIGIYRELLERKKFREPNDINEFRMIQKMLPEGNKMGISLTGTEGNTSCGAICTAIGDMGVYLFGACDDNGMKTNGSYLLQWKTIQWMKEMGCTWYNLNGINPIKNPGTYHFKAGIAGKNGRSVRYLGRFDSYTGAPKAVLINLANLINVKLKQWMSGKKDH